MFNSISNLFSLLTRQEKRKLALLLLAIVMMATLQASSVASIMPFLAVVANGEIVHTNEFLNYFYALAGRPNINDFLFLLGLAVLVVLILSNGIAALTTWGLLRFSHLMGFRLSRRLLGNYINRPYVFFLDRNTTELTKNILSEADRVTRGLFVPILQLVAQIVATCLIITLLVVVDPVMALIVASILSFAYTAIFAVTRKKVRKIGKQAIEAGRLRYKITLEAFGVIKYAKLRKLETQIINHYSRPSRLFARCNATSRAISQLPKYALDVIAFGGVLIFVLYLVKQRDAVSDALPLLGLYAFAGYRLLPQLQQIFNGASNIRYNAPALEILLSDFNQPTKKVADSNHTSPSQLDFEKSVKIDNATFTYPGAEKPTIENLNLSIEKGTIVGLVGPTGSGKTTIIDIILGLLEPDDGKIIVDETKLTPNNLPAWQNDLGYVPQHIYLIDESIKNNIAFGVTPDDIDQHAVERAAKTAQLYDFVTQSLPKGFDTPVGEKGLRLSGGEIQRIGIARALYNIPEILILDEATSALDAITESKVLNAITDIAQGITIVMITHRLTTLRACDKIHVLQDGAIISSGSYVELSASSPQFVGMTKAAMAH